MGRTPSTVSKEERLRAVQKKFYQRHRERLIKEKAAWVKEDRLKHPDKYKESLVRQKKTRMKKKYGITSEKWAELFESQDSRCAICRSGSTAGQGWHTDHCHTGNFVRGILCYHCNVMLGLARDNTQILEAAIAYLKEHTHE